MINFEYFIAHEYENPAYIFFYKPILIEPNIVKAQILSEHNIDFDKTYQLYLNLGGINFTLLVKPLKKVNNEVIFVVKDSKIELRKYPRLKTDSLNIEVSSDNISGKLLDISLGGCKIRVDGGLIEPYTRQSARKILKFHFPDGKTYSLTATVVNANPANRTIAFSFPKRSENIVKVYSLIVDMLKKKDYKGELPEKVE
jgi:hypothetical protein